MLAILLDKIVLVWHQAVHFHPHQKRQEWGPPRSLPRYTPIRTLLKAMNSFPSPFWSE